MNEQLTTHEMATHFDTIRHLNVYNRMFVTMYVYRTLVNGEELVIAFDVMDFPIFFL